MGVTFGLALDFQSPVRTLDQQIDRHLDLIRLAERYGYDSVTAGEGYSVRLDWGHLSSPLLALAALAPRTRLRLGTGVTLLPTWHPLKLAYDAAVLDQLSGGRLILGVGVGGPALHARFGLNGSRVADYVDDTLAILRALWAGQDGFRGKYLSVERGIGLLPIQPGGPPIWVGGAIRRSAERAAQWGDGYIASTNYSFDQVAQQSERYRSVLGARGKDPTTAVVVANRLALVADSETQARRAARDYCGRVLQRYARMGSLGPDPSIAAKTAEELFEACDENRCLVGTPDQVVARIRRYADAGVTHIQARVSPDAIPLEIAARTVELMGQSVLPQFR